MSTQRTLRSDKQQNLIYMQRNKSNTKKLASEGNRRKSVNRVQGGFNTHVCSVLILPPPLVL